MLERLTREDFASRINQRFRMRGDGAELELVEASAIDSPSSAGRAPFALLFRGPGDSPMAQRMYELEHPELGALALFLVPVGRDGDGTLYEAVFN